MSNNRDCDELVQRAQRGEQASLDRLACLAGEKLRTYLYRLTLDRELTEDLLQETLLHMVESLKELNQAEAFWAWLYRTALGKAQHHFRDKVMRSKPKVSRAHQANGPSSTTSEGTDGLSTLIQKELVEATFEAMKRLTLRQRGVVVLRCFEQRSYADIADMMGCSEIAAEVLFFRAKRSLRRHLSNRGFKGVLLAVGLGGFARRTSSAAVAASVSGASLEVGLAAKAIGTMTVPFGLGTTAAIAALVLGLVAWSANGHGDPAGPPGSTAARSPNQVAMVDFAYPSRVLGAHDPDGDGWKGIQADQVASVSVDPNEWLVGPPHSAQSCVVLPAGHWVELEFEGPILDGPGNDIEVVEWGANSEEAHVYVTDGNGRQRFVGTMKAPDSGLQISTVAGFDIGGIPLPFAPRAVRIVSRSQGGGTPGFDLHAVRARIERTKNRN